MRTDPAATLQALFRGKWRFRVVRELQMRPARLSELRRSIPDCSKKVLIDTLHDLEEMGWVVRLEYPSSRRWVEYSIAEEWVETLLKVVTDINNQ